MALVYKITCLPTGKIYVGWTSLSLAERWKRHLLCDKGCYIQNCIAKYGESNFVVEMVQEYQNAEDAIAREIELIKELQLNISRFPDGPGMNMTDGGEGTIGYRATRKHRENLSKALAGKSKSPKHVSNISKAKLGVNNPMYGRKPTDKQRESSRLRFKENNPNKPGEKSHRYGKPGHWKGKALPHEIKEKIRSSLKGRKKEPRSDEVKKKLSEATKRWLARSGHPSKGRKMSEDSREKMRRSRLAYIEKQKKLGLPYNHTKREADSPDDA